MCLHVHTVGAFTLQTSRFLKSRHLDPTIYTCAKNREVSVSQNFTIFWLLVRMCDHKLCMHSCMQRMQYVWGPRIYRYTFQRARVASSPEVPRSRDEKSRHFRKIALRLGIFLAMFRECLCVVARQLAPKCCDFSNVAKLARQCKWPYYVKGTLFNGHVSLFDISPSILPNFCKVGQKVLHTTIPHWHIPPSFYYYWKTTIASYCRLFILQGSWSKPVEL